MAPDTIAAMPTFDDDEPATPSAGLGIGGLDMSGMGGGMSLSGSGGDFTPAGSSALAGGLTAAELEAHLAATLGGLHTGGISAKDQANQEQKASAPIRQGQPDSASAPSAWGAAPPGMVSTHDEQQMQQQMQWQQQAQAAAAAAANLAPQIRAAQRHVSGLEAQLSQLRAQGGAATEHLNRLKAAQSKAKGATPASEEAPQQAPSDKAAKATATAEDNLESLSKAHSAAQAEWQRAAGALGAMMQQYQHAAAVARHAGLMVPSLVTPPTAVGSLASVVAYGQSPWQDVQPRKRTGKHMTTSDVGYVNRCLGGGLRKTGVDSSRAEWYAHALRAKRIQLAAASRGDPSPTTAALFPPSAIPSATAAQEAFVAGAGRLTHAVQSRAWEERNHVLGRVDKSTVARPRRMLALGDASDINKSRGVPLLQHLAVQREAAVKAALELKAAADAAAKEAAAAQAAEVGGVQDETEGGSQDESKKQKSSKKGGKRNAKGGKGGKQSAPSDKAILADAERMARKQGAAALASALVGQSGGANPLGAAKVEGTALWNARQMVDAVAAARVAYLDAALTYQAVQSAGDKASPLALRATQAAVEGAQLALGTALGLYSEGAWPKEGDSAPAPPGDGAVVLGTLVGLTKGKKALLRAAQYVPQAALLALVTASMEHLPMFVASMSVDPDAPVVDDQVALLLDRCIRGANVPVKSTDGSAGHPVAVAAATLQLMCHWMQALLEHNSPDTVAALFDLPNGGQVLAALLECGEGLAGAQLAEGAPPAATEAVTAAVQRWHALTDAMNASVMQAHGMA